MYDTITPAQWVIGLVVSLIAFGVLTWLMWHYFPRDGRVHNMSSSEDAPILESVPKVIHVPVSPTSTEISTSAAPSSGTDSTTPDTDAANAGTDGWEMPRISRRLTDRDTIALLAVQRTPAGKLRYSANQIAQLVGGSRGEVLALVKTIREGPAEFRPLTPEQAAARDALGLEKRGAA